ncbi:LysM peptidoglycan-binding domain-containing protein [Paenibacillus sediminis]|uniref:Stage VI sporulation protein D n=1 Tax=Paenibacillus sediminis TaxID=664909 RepID=A0ABS4H701_9BACL|nr:LysM peptidoglycan-binding domain-containing protein [Paenibacillus sediminis]MBP1938311.1 stage VI sporulation protein D [Paenibacillus sediminis]
MSDQSYGLRFDIYERVHLSEDLVGIEELEEIELVPNIQVIPTGEQAILRGQLILTGVYRGEGPEAFEQELQHFIPVEITIPLNRVSRLEDIAVEIENFDIDLLSKRSLNITGVLSLRGVGVVHSEPERQWDVDEFTVVHDSNSFGSSVDHEVRDEQEAVPYSGDSFSGVPNQANHDISWLGSLPQIQTSALYADKEYNAEPQVNSEFGQPLPEQYLENQRDQQENTDVFNTWNDQHEDAADLTQAEEYVSLIDDQTIAVDAAVEQQSYYEEPNDTLWEQTTERIPEEKPELKVALGSKKQAEQKPAENVGLSTLLHTNRIAKEQQSLQEREDENAQAASAPGEEIRWKNLFVNTLEEQSPFRKLRLCIVQREETIDTIATRYQLTPRELLLYNRLSEQSVTEGQILYIP